MSEALIKSDMFSNPPQERPEETVPAAHGGEGGGGPQMVPCNVSSCGLQNESGWGENCRGH